MPLLFNDKPLDENTIKEIVREKMPTGSNKQVTFTLNNAPIMMRRTEKGERVMKPGGTKPMSTSVLANINGVEGVLTYYTSKNYIQGKGGTETNYEPKYVYFRAGEMMVNGQTDMPLFALMLKCKYNEDNAKLAGVNPVYRMMDTSAASKKKIVGVNDKLKAYDLVREALAKNKPKLRALYQALGKTDWIEKAAIKDWDSILDPIYTICESNPSKIITLLESASLDTGAKVTQAIEQNILKGDNLGYYWHKNGKKIWAVPAGKADEGLDLFVNFLRNEDKSGVLQQVTKELEEADIKATLAT